MRCGLMRSAAVAAAALLCLSSSSTPVSAQAPGLRCTEYSSQGDWRICTDYRAGTTATEAIITASAAPAVAGGWIAFGFGTRMADGQVMIGYVPTSGTGVIDNYSLGNHFLGSTSNSIGATSKSVTSSGGRTELSFTVPLTNGKSTLFSDDSKTPIIFARGPQVNSGIISMHSAPNQHNQQSLNFATGEGGGSSSAQTMERYRAAHGVMMAIAWALLIPLGIIAARYFKAYNPLWFHMHRLLIISGVALALAAFIIGLAKIADGAHSTHRALGIATMVLALANPFIALVRPHPPATPEEKPTTARRVWEIVHHNVGRAAYVMAVVNCFIGLSYFNLSRGEINEYTIGFLVVLCAVLAFGVGLEIHHRLRPGSPPFASCLGGEAYRGPATKTVKEQSKPVSP